MYVTEPSEDALCLVKNQFAKLWRKVETEIETATRRNSEHTDRIQTVANIALAVKCHVEDIHIARTAPIVGSPRRIWRSQRFMVELSQAEQEELAEPWRSSSAWQLEKVVNPALFRSSGELYQCREDPFLISLFSVHDGSEDEITFAGELYACSSWVRLLVDLSINQLSIIQQSWAVSENARISADDYDAINAAFDAIPGFNYAAQLANDSGGRGEVESSDESGEPSETHQTADDNQSNSRDEEIGQASKGTKRTILMALFDGKAWHYDNRMNSPDIARWMEGKTGEVKDQTIRLHTPWLKDHDFIDGDVAGGNSGFWLKPKGKKLARKLAKR